MSLQDLASIEENLTYSTTEYTSKKEGAIEHNKVAEGILKDHKLIYSNGLFYEYINGVYSQIGNETIQTWIKTLIGKRFKRDVAGEVLFSLQTEAYIKPDKLNTGKYLNLKNGLFDLGATQLLTHTPEEYSTIQLGVNYDPDNWNCKKWLQTIYEIFDNDESKVNALQEFFGLCLTQDTRYEKALFMLGEGRNGKSTILYVLENLIGEANRSAVPLEKLCNSHYVANLYGKLVNVSIETNAKSEVYDAVFKQIVTGDSLEADRKYGQPFTFRPYCKLIFALNNMPRVNDKTLAFYRRLLILKFDRQFDDSVANKNLKFELLEELDGIFLWCLEGLRNLRKRGYFEIDAKMKAEIEEYRRENNNVLLFVEEECKLSPDESVIKQVLYATFSEWCKNNGYKPLSKKRFGMELNKQFKLESSQSKDAETRAWTWEGIGLASHT